MKKLEKIRICDFKQIYDYLFEKWVFSMSKGVKLTLNIVLLYYYTCIFNSFCSTLKGGSKPRLSTEGVTVGHKLREKSFPGWINDSVATLLAPPFLYCNERWI
jgi:hypothetical protein